MTFALGRLFLSAPITARNLLFSSHNKATRNSPPQCQLRRQNHGGGVIKFDVAGKEPIVNPEFCLSQNGINSNPSSSTPLMRRFCRMYFGRRRRISSASGSNPPEEHDLDQDGAATAETETEEVETETKFTATETETETEAEVWDMAY
ncbi:hypothetical protein LINPERHAP1_LOCUS34843 [Linum perenne]